MNAKMMYKRNPPKMCQMCLGVCPIFQKMIIKYLVPGTDLGMGAPFCHQGLLLGTKFGWWCQHMGTRKIGLVPGGLVFLPSPIYFICAYRLWDLLRYQNARTHART